MKDEIEDEKSSLSSDVESWAKMKMNRRKALSSAAKAAIGAAAVIIIGGVAYYAYTASVQPTTTTTVPTPTATTSTVTVSPTATTTTVTASPTTTVTTTTATITATTPTSYAPSRPMVMAVWAWNPQVVETNLEVFNQQYGENATLDIVPGDYWAVNETKMIAKSPLDMLYTHSAWMVRWYKAGWIQPVDDEEHAKEISAEMIPYLWDYLKMPDGKHAAWIYWFGSFNVSYNGKILKEAGLADEDGWITDQPKTWDDLISQCVEMKKRGISEYPWLPRYNQEISWNMGLHFEYMCTTEGEQLIDLKTHEPSFDVNTPAYDVLDNMRRAWVAGITPEGAMAQSFTENILTFAKGEIAYSMQIDYDMGSFNNPDISPDAGWYHIMSPAPGKVGANMVFPAYYAITNHKQYDRSPKDAKRVEALHQFYSWKDKEGKYRVAKTWMRDYLLGQAFTTFFKDPEVVGAGTAWEKYMTPRDVEVVLKNDLEGRPLMAQQSCVWYSAWRDQLPEMLAKAVVGEMSVKDTITEMRKLADEMYKRYGGIEVWK